MNTKQKARIALVKGGAIKDISARYKISVNTLKSWKKRMRGRTEVAPQVAPKPAPNLQWLRSLYHDSAHLVNSATGEGVCGAKVPMGAPWFPAEETKRCTRCQGYENKALRDYPNQKA